MFNTLDYLSQILTTPRLTFGDILDDHNRERYGRIAFWLAVAISVTGTLFFDPQWEPTLLGAIFGLVFTGLAHYISVWLSAWIMYGTLRLIRVRTNRTYVKPAMIATYFTSVWAALAGVVNQVLVSIVPVGTVVIVGLILGFGATAIHIIASSVAFKVPVSKVVMAVLLQFMIAVTLTLVGLFFLLSSLSVVY